jgi:hypothetical protein
MGVVSIMLKTLYPQGKSPWYPLNRRLGGPQSRFGHGGEEKNSQPLPGLKLLTIQSVGLSPRYQKENFTSYQKSFITT